jgi:hypothetical protein
MCAVDPTSEEKSWSRIFFCGCRREYGVFYDFWRVSWSLQVVKKCDDRFAEKNQEGRSFAAFLIFF